MGNKQSKSDTKKGATSDAGNGYSYPLGILKADNLPPIPYEYPINESDKGLFVVIKNVEFGYEHYLENDTWKESSPLKDGYDKDGTLLFETFNIKKSDTNVKYGANLGAYNPNDSDEGMYDRFMEQKVLNYGGEPKFVFVTLMSHGFANGVFLLAGTNAADPCCEEPSRGQHSHTDMCHERRLKEDLIEPIQKKFVGIPKIFLIQICRGGKADDLAKSAMGGSEVEAPKPEDFTPRTADTLVIYAGAEDQLTWVDNRPKEKQPVGSLMIYEFCQAVLQLEKRLLAVSPTLESLKKLSGQSAGEGDEMRAALNYLQSEIAGEHPDPNIRIDIESAVGGWIGDICRVTSANVARRYMIEEKTTTNNGFIVDRNALTKSQPEVKSSFHSKLSCVKMMRTQIPAWGKPSSS